MTFDWRNYLTLARELAARSDEASLRSAISRAYYAVFHAARERLTQEGTAIYIDPGSHTALWNAFLFSNESGARYYVGLDGDSLRRARNRADYENDIRDLPGLTKSSLRKAEQALAGLDRLAAAQQPSPEPP